jgi:peptide/nickel transport system permease protein
MGMFALLGATLVIFAGSRYLVDPVMAILAPIDEMDDASSFTPEQIDGARKKLRLDRPVPVQYVLWLWDVARGNLGEDINDTQRPISQKLREKFPHTLQLAVPAYILAALVGIPIGVLSAVTRGSPWDLMGRVFAAFGSAVPEFWVAVVAILIFGLHLDLLPMAGKGEGLAYRNYILPVSIMGLTSTAGYVRIVRSTMLEVLDSEFVKLARSKGVSERVIIWRHAFRNALLAPLTVAGLMLVGFITGSVAVEVVFAWPGIAAWAVQAVLQNNLPVVVATTLVFTCLYIGASFTVDILYGFLDPRIRYS